MANGFNKLGNEAAVELRAIVPLFEPLGYEVDDISPKHRVVFQHGRAGRKHEADFVLFAGPLHNEDTSLVVVEAKSPEGDLDEGRRQAGSYALATRAPVLLTCDGNTLEVWQLNLARSSDKVLSFAVSEIEGRRSDLERYLRKEAVVDYCRRVSGKNIVETTADFGRYEDAELRRTLSFDRSIDRRLKNRETGSLMSSRALVDVAPPGAVIVGPSGLGKTDLSHQLLRSEISRRWHDRAGRVPVQIPLLDLGPNEPILEFAANRLTPYNASVTVRSMPAVIRDQGLTVILDEFDRLADDDRLSRESELRLLLRDYANLRVFVFSRLSARPALLAQPTYELIPLDDEEKFAVLQAKGTPHPATVLHLMPPLLRDLCSNPLILVHTVHHYQTTGGFPNRIEQTFRNWLDHTTRTNGRSLATSAQREAALGALAQQKSRGRISATDALAHLGRAGFPPDLLDDLVRCDAVVVTNGTVNFQHEALADYLRALAISRLASPNLGTAIETAEFEAGSLFPVLLMALLDTPEAQGILWRRLARIDFATYLEVLRYRADVSAVMSSADLAELTRGFLHDVHEGVAVPLDAFLPALRAPILGELVGEDTEDFDVVGAVDAQSASYSFVPTGTATRFDADDLISQGRALRLIMLAPSGLRLDSGRLLGLLSLREALLKLIDARHLRGRLQWTSERITSRLHYLRREHRIHLRVTAPLVEWHDLLSRQSDAVMSSTIPSQFLFSVRSLLDDIATLRANGFDSLADASPRLGRPSEQHLDAAALARELHEHYRMMQMLYREVAEESFAPIVKQLGFYNVLPVRWHITVVAREPSFRTTICDDWMPVEGWDQAGADVVFSDSPRRWEEADFIRMRDELQRLGRLNRYTAIFGGGWRLLDGFNNSYGVVADMESSPFSDACRQLRRDVEHLFSKMPSNDRAPSWDHIDMPAASVVRDSETT